MPFADLQEFFDPTLRLPIGGKEYVVPSPDAKTGVWCQRLLTTGVFAASGAEVTDSDLAAIQLDDDQERNLYQRVLGAAFEEMVADGVPWEMVRHAGATAFMWVASGREAAEECWAAPMGEARRPARRTSAKKKSARPASRGSSSRTATPASPTGSPTSS